MFTQYHVTYVLYEIFSKIHKEISLWHKHLYYIWLLQNIMQIEEHAGSSSVQFKYLLIPMLSHKIS